MDQRRIFITGTAGFIGYHLAELLLAQGHIVGGYDGMTDYYDVRLKQRRHAMLNQHEGFSATEAMLEDQERLDAAISSFQPDVIVHLAAQAGVRYSIDNPRAYLDANIVGTFNVMEAARAAGVQHLLMASTSSVYGANTDMPFTETERVATPLTFYAASKLANEAMGHSYAHIYNLPVTMFRFFTVYGPWGRPDMALFKFTKGIIDGTPIDIYNNGDMWRDFTYVEDLVRGIAGLIEATPQRPEKPEGIAPGDSLSPAAPFRVVNIGNSDKVRLMDFVDAIEAEIGKKAIRNYMPMQQGDVPATWADASLLQSLTGYRPETPFREGVARFVRWYRDYYEC
ncbi:NAD-dependent epimerase/dehydratase family protein [Sphingorhabdus sp.]|uniref:NAD-dependent epimerase/dehydratase family protein n=1 Tax=Sphingorhabdus sp. TaxID=1902408 RepID=UPI0032B8063C